TERLQESEILKEQKNSEELETMVQHYSERYNLEVEDVRDVLESMDESKAESIFEKMINPNTTKTFLGSQDGDDEKPSALSESCLSEKLFKGSA
ncbi:MAG: hypothetical protein ACTSRU_14285, partial [Candidatus Hodarchaeales archaeon]